MQTTSFPRSRSSPQSRRAGNGRWSWEHPRGNRSDIRRRFSPFGEFWKTSRHCTGAEKCRSNTLGFSACRPVPAIRELSTASSFCPLGTLLGSRRHWRLKGRISSPSTDSAGRTNRRKSKFSELFTNPPPTSSGAAHSRAVVGFLQAPANPQGMNKLPPVGGYSQLLILPRRGKSLPPPSNRPAIKPTHSARASPPIIVSLARRETIILRISPDRTVVSASVPALPSEILAHPILFRCSEIHFAHISTGQPLSAILIAVHSSQTR